MGRGDKKTKKGKIFMGSFGKTRPKGKSKVKSGNSAKTEKAVNTKE